MNTKTTFGLSIVAAAMLVSGCTTTRSISNSGYRETANYRHDSGPVDDFAYQGELSEFDVLGIDTSKLATEEQIARALDASGRVSLHKGSSVLLIQSGAMQPDPPMVAALEKQFVVVPFSGQRGGQSGAGYSRSLRLAAAQAGCETVICCWGTLESATKGNETKTLSWVPVVGWVLPDESQQMRIHLKVALVDVRSGRWTLHSSEAFEDRAHSNRLNREGADQKQVERLKCLAYASAAGDVVSRYSR
jgi:hypothetical protein